MTIDAVYGSVQRKRAKQGGFFFDAVPRSSIFSSPCQPASVLPSAAWKSDGLSETGFQVSGDFGGSTWAWYVSARGVRSFFESEIVRPERGSSSSWPRRGRWLEPPARNSPLYSNASAIPSFPA